jgi:putative ABC transport system permease protein
MSDLLLILSSLKSRWLNSLLSVFLTAFGVMLALLIIQFGHHIQNRLSADGQGIDIVVGAKGSPLQLILSSVYHIDIPTGNIPYDEAQKWMKHPQIKTAIPLALGDNWKGYRIVGTTPDYMKHYGAELIDGHIWDKAFEAVAGASVGLKIGDEFTGAHGLMAGGHEHEEERYKITGVMKPTGTVLDRLILTSLDSVLEIHGLEGVEHEHHHDEHAHEHHEEETHGDHAHNEEEHDHEHAEHEGHEGHDHEKAGEPEVTALLLTTKSPIANINLPRSINRESALQAANPGLEMARLTSMLGLGSQSFAALSALLITIAALSIFAGLAGSLENRMGDLAVLRAIGYSKRRVFKIITLEGMLIVFSGLALGLVMGLGGFVLLTHIMAPLQASGATISFTSDFILVIFAVLLAGLIAAILPALRASRVDVARQLSRSA